MREQSKRDGVSIAALRRAGFQQDPVRCLYEPRRERRVGLPPIKPLPGRPIALQSLRPPGGDIGGIGVSCERYLPTGGRPLQRGEESEEGARTRDSDYFRCDCFFRPRDGFLDPARVNPSPPHRVELLPSCRYFGRLEGLRWGKAGACDGVPERVREPRDLAGLRILGTSLLSLGMEGDLHRLCLRRSCGRRSHPSSLRQVEVGCTPWG